MATTENKVQFNIKNVHYAVLTGEDTWGTPVAVPGAVNLDLSASGDMEPFYADGIVYYKSSANNGYEGDLEMARFIDQMLQDVWGVELVETDNVMIERADVEPKAFALLFQIDGDADNDLYVLYNCTGTRPNIGARPAPRPKRSRRRPARFPQRRWRRTTTFSRARPQKRLKRCVRTGSSRCTCRALEADDGKESDYRRERNRVPRYGADAAAVPAHYRA